MRKSLLTAVSAAALISAGMVSPTFAQSNTDTDQSSQVEPQATEAPDANGSMNSDAASDSAPVASDNARSGDTMQSEGDAADSGEMDADTSDMNEANDGAMTGDTGDMATEQPEGTYLASELTGEPVQNAEGEDLAGIEDFVIGQDGTISHVIVSFGGFLGLGDKEVMLPWDQFEITTDPEDEDDLIARLNMTEEEIEALPEFKSQEEVREETERQAEPATTGTATGTGTTGTATGTTGTTAQ